jgi:predicted MFS family arabinose efflux permease
MQGMTQTVARQDMPVLKIPGFRPLLLAEIISTSGAQLGLVALPWLVLTTTRSPAKMGWVMAAELAPVALFGAVGGVLAARLGPRRWMIMSDLLRCLLVALIPSLYAAGGLRFPVLLALVFAIGLFQAPYIASQQGILTSLVAGNGEATLGRATSMLMGAVRITLLLGPPAGAALIPVTGAPAVLLVSAGTYLISAIVIQGAIPSTASRSQDDKLDLTAGFRTLFRDRLLLFWTLGTVITESAWQALFAAIPVIALTRFRGDVHVVGSALGAFGAGALAGSLLAVPAVRRWPSVWLANAGKLLQAMAFIPLTISASETGLAGFLFLAGLFNGLTVGPSTAVRLVRIPAATRAQTLTLISAITVLGGTSGLATGGVALSAFGEQSTLACIAIAQVLGFLLFALGTVPVRARREH